MVKTTRFMLLCLLLASVLPLAAATKSDMLVSTEWLAGHAQDPGLVILHVSASRDSYDAAHIPGARFVALSDIVVTRDGIPNELPPVEALDKVFEAAGVSDNSRVILYADGSVLPATRAYFTLDYLGHGDQTALLDGGLNKWQAENRAVTKAVPQVAKASFTPHVRPDLVASTQDVKGWSGASAGGNGGIPTLLDARSASNFTGESERAGHIPGAVNVDWVQGQESQEDTALKSEAQLRALYSAVPQGKKVVTYCNSGMQASQSYFTLKYLGYDVQLYDGSLSEWRATPGTTVAK